MRLSLARVSRSLRLLALFPLALGGFGCGGTSADTTAATKTEEMVSNSQTARENFMKTRAASKGQRSGSPSAVLRRSR